MFFDAEELRVLREKRAKLNVDITRLEQAEAIHKAMKQATRTRECNRYLNRVFDTNVLEIVPREARQRGHLDWDMRIPAGGGEVLQRFTRDYDNFGLEFCGRGGFFQLLLDSNFHVTNWSFSHEKYSSSSFPGGSTGRLLILKIFLKLAIEPTLYARLQNRISYFMLSTYVETKLNVLFLLHANKIDPESSVHRLPKGVLIMIGKIALEGLPCGA